MTNRNTTIVESKDGTIDVHAKAVPVFTYDTTDGADAVLIRGWLAGEPSIIVGKYRAEQLTRITVTFK